MKKLFLSFVAIAAMVFASSCQQEKMEAELQGGSTVTFTVEMPAAAAATRAVGEADNVDNLVYAVYRVLNKNFNDDEAKAYLEHTNTTDYQLIYQDDTPVLTDDQTRKKTASVSLELINDQRYVVIFWAQKDYTWFNEGAPFTSVAYPANLDGNNDSYDAFSGVSVVSVDGSVSKNITLVRPFAQVNIATAMPSTERYPNFAITNTKVTVAGLASSFNIGKQTGVTPATTVFAEAAPLNEQFSNATYPKYISMNYIFVPENQSNVEVSYVINTNDYGTVKNTVSNVPVARNYRTNIIGNLLTSDVKYNVELAPWESNNNSGTTEVIVDGIVKNQNGDYEITTVNGFAYAINNLFVDENGMANSATFYIKPGTYDFSEYDVTRPNVTSGTLKIYDIEPVVTRATSSTSGVVITGLSGAIIGTVSDGATVFFSGITVQNFEGDNDSAALVQDNQGKVVLVGCAIVDENGDDDEDATLVGGNAPVELEKDEVSPDGLIYTEEQLAAAFANEDAETISLGADIAVESPLVFPQGRIATLDLRGWKLTIAGDDDKVASTYAICNLGDLTIKDSYALGEVNARGIYNGYDNGNIYREAKLTIESGTFNAKGTNGGAAVFNYGELEIEGGKFTSVGSYSINTQEGGKITVEGGEIAGGMYLSNCEAVFNEGKISGNRSGCHTVYCYNANVTINGGEFYNYNSGNSTIMAAGSTEITYNGGTFGIKDGRVEGNGNTCTSCLLDSQNSATSTIKGGTFNGGFRVQAGTTMTIQGGSFNDCTGSNYNIYGTVTITGGTYTDDTAKAFATKHAHKDYKIDGENVVAKVYTVKIGENQYETIAEAVDAAKDGEEITLIADVKQSDGVLIENKNLTIDLNGKTFTVEEGASTNNRNFKVIGTSTVTIENGTMVAEGEITSGAYGTVRTEDGAIVTLDNVKLYSYRGYGLNVKANTGTKITINNSEIYSQYSGGVEADGGEIELNNVKIDQKGVYSSGNWCSVAIGVNGGGKVTVNSGEYSAATIQTDANAAQGTWVAYVMSSGGTLDIKGGTFTGVVAETASAANACGLICADRAAVVNIYDGIFNSNGAILDMRNNVGTQPNPVATLAGGIFSADPRKSGLYSSNLIKVKEGCYVISAENGKYSVVEINGTVVTPETIAETNFNQNATFYLVGDFKDVSAVNITPEDGVNAVVDATYATFGSRIKFNIPSVPDNAKVLSRENGRKGDYTLKNFSGTTIALGAYGTSVSIKNSTLDCIDVYAANIALDINGNTIDSKYEIHPRTTDGQQTDYAACLMMMAYDLKFDNNVVKNAIGHVVAINGLKGTFGANVANSGNNVQSFTGNTISGISGSTKDNRAGFKIWDDMTYAFNGEKTFEALPAAGQNLITTVDNDQTNVFIKAENTSNTAYKINFYEYYHKAL